jgi:hypothetical protein
MVELARASACKNCYFVRDGDAGAPARLAAFAQRMKGTLPRPPWRPGDFNSDFHFMRYRPKESKEFIVVRLACSGLRAPAAGEAAWICRREFPGAEGGDSARGDKGAAA